MREELEMTRASIRDKEAELWRIEHGSLAASCRWIEELFGVVEGKPVETAEDQWFKISIEVVHLKYFKM